VSAYDWGDPKNPEYVEWLLNQVDQRRKDFYQKEPQRIVDRYIYLTDEDVEAITGKEDV
jgi:hypothetical protein